MSSDVSELSIKWRATVCGESGISSSELLFVMWIVEEKYPLVTPRCEGVTIMRTYVENQHYKYTTFGQQRNFHIYIR
jgi:hypothetical protein